jgi:hypothetical protein
MRLNGNSHSDWISGRKESSAHILLVAVVACAVGATASAGVILSLLGSVIVQPRVPSIAPRVIASNNTASGPANIAQDQAATETAIPQVAIPTMPETALPVNQTQAGRQVHSHRLRKLGRVAGRPRETYWRHRFTNAYSQLPRVSYW